MTFAFSCAESEVMCDAPSGPTFGGLGYVLNFTVFPNLVPSSFVATAR